MRIISKLRDYYDSVQSLGQDQSIIYLRETKEIETRKHYVYPQSFTACMIGFCGDVYAVLHARFQGDLEGWCYSAEDCDRFVEGNVKDWDRDRYFGIGSKRRRRRSFSSYNNYASYTTQAGIKTFFENWNTKGHVSLEKIFHEHNAPIFVWEPTRTVINPLLRPYEFFRVKDSFTAFQELQGYVGGVLRAKVNPVPDIPDEIMQEIKGFDHEYSFRKEPEGA